MTEISAQSKTYLCRLDEIPDGQGRGFVFGEGTARWAIFVVRRGGAVHAYENSCPHLGTPLDFVTDRFLSRGRGHIQCSTHHALFEIETGYCVTGPCKDKSLAPVAVKIEAGAVVLTGAPSSTPGQEAENAAVQ